MSFAPASPISIITCEHCQGNGCQQCNQHGIYATQENQPIAFNLPDFIDLKSRRLLKRILLVKRIVLLTISLSLIIAALTIFL